jgi:hypothetical protein
MQPSPLKMIVTGAGGVVLFGAVGIWFIFSSADHYTSADVELVNGTIREVSELDEGRGSRGLQVWLNEEQLPFRSSGTYPSSFNQGVLHELVPGAQASIEIATSERSYPRLARSEGQQFRNTLSLKVGDHVALSLESYNAWSRENRELGKIVLPIMFLLSILSVVGGLLWRQSAKA